MEIKRRRERKERDSRRFLAAVAARVGGWQEQVTLGATPWKRQHVRPQPPDAHTFHWSAQKACVRV